MLSQACKKLACMGFSYVECSHDVGGPENRLPYGFEFPQSIRERHRFDPPKASTTTRTILSHSSGDEYCACNCTVSRIGTPESLNFKSLKNSALLIFK